jgi:hypothetical protein
VTTTRNPLDGLPVLWRGTDDTTPAGCELIVTEVVGIPTTYLLRDDQIIGRVEGQGRFMIGYVGDTLKGGYYVGTGDYYGLFQNIVNETIRGLQ